MSFFDGFVSGAAESASGIIGQQMRDDSDLKKQQAFAQFQADLAERKAITLQKLQEELNIRAEGRGLDNRSKERQMVVDEGIANAPRLRDAQIEDFKAKKKAEYDPEIQELTRKAETDKLTSHEQAKLKFYTDNKPYIIGQTRDMAIAGNIDNGAGLRKIQMESAQMALDEQKATAKMPQAVRDLAGSYREQLKSLSTTIDKGTLEGTATPEGLKALDDRRSALSQKLTETLRPYLGDKTAAATSATQDVTINGKVIGQAGSADEARELVKKYKAGNAGATAEKKPSFPTQSGSHSDEPKKPAVDVNREIQDRVNRIKLRGVSEETKIRLIQEIEELKRGNSQFSSFINR